jgi:hypothetical protein
MNGFFVASLAEASIALPIREAVQNPGHYRFMNWLAFCCNLWTPNFHRKRMASNFNNNLPCVNLCMGRLSLERFLRGH